MTDAPRPPGPPALPSATPAIPAKQAPTATKPDPAPDDASPAAVGLTFGQHVFIWSMILLVGIIFGVGSTVGILEQGPSYIDDQKDITAAEVTARRVVTDRLETALNPNPERAGRFLFRRNETQWAMHIRMARIAAKDGLVPVGATLDRLVAEFLAEKSESGRTYGAVLKDQVGSKYEVDLLGLRMFLAERQGVDALMQRTSSVPAVPAIAAELMAEEKFTVDQVELTAAQFLKPVAEEDPEIETAYQRLRPTRFTAPAAADLKVAFADINVLRSKLVNGLTEADLKAWYDSHPGALTRPKADKPTETEPIPFAEAKDQVRDKLSRERAVPEALKLVAAFNEVVSADGLTERDSAAFSLAAEKAGLKVQVHTLAEKTDGKAYALGDLGGIHDVVGFFNRSQAPGLITNLIHTDGAESNAVIIRLDARRESGFKPLAEVKPQVREWLAGRRAWKDLLAAAEAARAAAAKTGLAAWAAAPEQAVWKTAVKSESTRPTRKIQAPPAEPDGPPGDSQPVAALALPGRPVALDRMEPAKGSDLPRVRLVQVTKIEPGPPQTADNSKYMVEYYRYLLRGYLSELAQERLRDRMGGR